MKIEVGKYYRTRDGRKVGPMAGVSFKWVRGKETSSDPEWNNDGTCREGFTTYDDDLIAEWTEPETGTLAELDVKPGDVVGLVDGGSAFYGNTYTIQDDGRVLDNENAPRYYGYAFGPDSGGCATVFRIISRASGTPKTWGQMTDAEKVEDLEQLFNKCVKGLVTEEYCNGYMEAIDHMMSRIKPEPARETVTLWWEQGCVAGRQYYDEATHRITFTTTNGKPDLDSIKMEALG